MKYTTFCIAVLMGAFCGTAMAAPAQEVLPLAALRAGTEKSSADSFGKELVSGVAAKDAALLPAPLPALDLGMHNPAPAAMQQPGVPSNGPSAHSNRKKYIVLGAIIVTAIVLTAIYASQRD